MKTWVMHFWTRILDGDPSIFLSVIALAISIVGAWWNYIKDTRYRADVRASLFKPRGKGSIDPWLEVINHGPGKVTLDFSIFESLPWWRRLLGRRSHKQIIFHQSPINFVLEPGGEPYRQRLPGQFFISGKGVTGIGVCDMMRRAYFVPTLQVWRVNRAIRNGSIGRGLRRMKPPRQNS